MVEIHLLDMMIDGSSNFTLALSSKYKASSPSIIPNF